MEALDAGFPAAGIRLTDAVASWSGIRPVLSKGRKDPSKESRDYIVWVKKGLVTATGGKLTTFRSLAKDALAAAAPWLPGALPVQTSAPAFAAVPRGNHTRTGLPPAALRRLYGRYGRPAESMLENADPRDLNPMPGTDTLWAELPLAAESQGIRHLSDLLLRRVRIGLLMPEGGRAHLDRIQSLCAPVLPWDEERWQAERRRYLALWQKAYSVPVDNSAEK
jgi:glycerol-3-phosphate dehydrogenase